MSCEVYANGNEISCKSGSNKVIAEFPDVCLSPPSPPAGPIPVPYPNTSFSKDMKKGSKTVKIKNKEVMLKDKSFYKTSPLGDEAATKSFGGNVLSHNITGKTYCVAWSMDVKFEGKNVDRHMDMTTSNHLCAPTPPGTPPASLTIGTMKPVVPGQMYSDQTCTDAQRDTLKKQKDAACKLRACPPVPKRPYAPRIAAEAPGSRAHAKLTTAHTKLCACLKLKTQDFVNCLNARQKIVDDCFASPKNTQDEKDRHKAHEDEYAEVHTGYQSHLQTVNQNC